MFLLLVKLPELLQSADIPSKKLKVLLKYLDMFLRYVITMIYIYLKTIIRKTWCFPSINILVKKSFIHRKISNNVMYICAVTWRCIENGLESNFIPKRREKGRIRQLQRLK